MIYFTSDLHLGHENAIGFTDRPFSDVEEMNNTLIQNINDMVGCKDELWILGDFTFRISREDVRMMRNRIKCKQVHLIRGNHDKDYSQDHIFQSVQSYKERTENRVWQVCSISLSDSGMECSALWFGSSAWTHPFHVGVRFDVYHSTGAYNEENLKQKYSDRFPTGHAVKLQGLGLRIYDVGVDANDYRPVSLEQIAKMMSLPVVSHKVHSN